MVALVANALSAYAKTAAAGASPGVAAKDTGPSFATFVKDAAATSASRWTSSSQASRFCPPERRSSAAPCRTARPRASS